MPSRVISKQVAASSTGTPAISSHVAGLIWLWFSVSTPPHSTTDSRPGESLLLIVQFLQSNLKPRPVSDRVRAGSSPAIQESWSGKNIGIEKEANGEGHLVVVLSRRYPEAKLQENMDTELMDVILQEAHDAFEEEIVIELKSDVSDEMETNLDRIEAWIKQWRQDNSASME